MVARIGLLFKFLPKEIWQTNGGQKMNAPCMPCAMVLPNDPHSVPARRENPQCSHSSMWHVPRFVPWRLRAELVEVHGKILGVAPRCAVAFTAA